MRSNFHQQWAESFARAGICHLTVDTCCRLLAVVYVYGGLSESFVFNKRLATDIAAAQRRLNIGEGLLPDGDCTKRLKAYVKELTDDASQSPAGEDPSAPALHVCHVPWALKLMKGYGLKNYCYDIRIFTRKF